MEKAGSQIRITGLIQNVLAFLNGPVWTESVIFMQPRLRLWRQDRAMENRAIELPAELESLSVAAQFTINNRQKPKSA